MRAAQVVRFIDQGNNVQVLCADNGGLLSVYFEHLPFISFYRLIRKAGLKLAGLQIEFNRESVSHTGDWQNLPGKLDSEKNTRNIVSASLLNRPQTHPQAGLLAVRLVHNLATFTLPFSILV